jgi:carbon-monoxide dehydrogenase medium subunit
VARAAACEQPERRSVITEEITFHAPKGVDEVLGLLGAHSDDAKILAGGMSLVPTMNLGLARPTILISLNHVHGLDGIVEDGDVLRLGAMVRHARVATDRAIAQHAPLLAEAAVLVGDPQVRNRGTLGGSVAHADPAADYLPALVALGAWVVVRSSTGGRSVPAAEFFVNVMQTALETNELLVEVTLPKAPAGQTSAYRRLSRVEGSFAIVNAAAVVDADGRTGRVAIGGIEARPLLIELTDLDEQRVDVIARVRANAIEAAAGAFADLNASVEYRQQMAGVFAGRAVAAALDRRGVPIELSN